MTFCGRPTPRTASQRVPPHLAVARSVTSLSFTGGSFDNARGSPNHRRAEYHDVFLCAFQFMDSHAESNGDPTIQPASHY